MKCWLKRAALVRAATVLIALGTFSAGSGAQEETGSRAPSVVQRRNNDIVFEPASTTGLPMDRYQVFERFAQQNPAIARTLANYPRLISSEQFVAKNPALRDFLQAHPEIKADFAENPGNFLDIPPDVEAAILAAGPPLPNPPDIAPAASPTRAAPLPAPTVSSSSSRDARAEAAPGRPPSREPAEDTSQGADLSTSVEIPQQAPVAAEPSKQEPSPDQPAVDQTPTPPINYEETSADQQGSSPELTGPPIRSLQEFIAAGDISSPLGIEVREDRRKLNSGGEAHGLLIVRIVADSPAAHAGLHEYRTTPRTVLETAAVAGALFFPPAVLLVPVLDQVPLGDSYDLIIGVDGSRVTNFLEFQDRLSDVQPGEIVYLSVLRNGGIVQVPVQVPAIFQRTAR